MASNVKSENIKPEVNKHVRKNSNRDEKRNRFSGSNRKDDRGFSARNQDDKESRRSLNTEKSENCNDSASNLTSSTKRNVARCRLFVGNLPSSIKDGEFCKMFEKYGEISEVFLNSQKGFGFVTMERQNAENAKADLDCLLKDGRQIRVKFASHGAALRVKNLSPWISNELLENAFSIFGDVERAVVVVDDRGKHLGEGIVEFSRKQSAQLALKRCSEGCFLLTSSPRPVFVETLEHKDEIDGFPEKNFQKGAKQFIKERELAPRLAEPGTFEFEFANRWKQLHELELQKRENLEKEIQEARQALDDQMDFAMYDHEANLLRERLRHMEEQSTLIQRERELRQAEEIRREEARRQQEILLRQQQEEILRRDLTRRHEENLMLQQAGFGDMFDREAALRNMQNMQQASALSPSIAVDSSSNMGFGNVIPGLGQWNTRFDQQTMGDPFMKPGEIVDMATGMPVDQGGMRGPHMMSCDIMDNMASRDRMDNMTYDRRDRLDDRLRERMDDRSRDRMDDRPRDRMMDDRPRDRMMDDRQRDRMMDDRPRERIDERSRDRIVDDRSRGRMDDRSRERNDNRSRNRMNNRSRDRIEDTSTHKKDDIPPSDNIDGVIPSDKMADMPQPEGAENMSHDRMENLKSRDRGNDYNYNKRRRY